jgi:exoribonuclease R
MLPKEMCLLCSLLPGDDKLTFSVFWEMSPEAEIVRHYFTRSVINSCAQLAYEHAQVNIYCCKAYLMIHKMSSSTHRQIVCYSYYITVFPFIQ